MKVTNTQWTSIVHDVSTKKNFIKNNKEKHLDLFEFPGHKVSLETNRFFRVKSGMREALLPMCTLIPLSYLVQSFYRLSWHSKTCIKTERTGGKINGLPRISTAASSVCWRHVVLTLISTQRQGSFEHLELASFLKTTDLATHGFPCLDYCNILLLGLHVDY